MDHIVKKTLENQNENQRIQIETVCFVKNE